MSNSPLPLRFDFLPAWQAAALYLMLAIPVLWLGARSMTGLASFRKWTAIAIRLDLLMFLVLLIAGARWEQTPKDLTVVVVRDVSRSTANVPSPNPAGLQMQVTQYLREAARNKPAGDRIGAVSFDRLSMVDALPSGNPGTAGDTAAVRECADGTNVAQALRMAMAAMPADTMRRIVLLWDGNATTGDLGPAVDAAASLHIPIDVVSLYYNIKHEICLERLVAPAVRRQDEAFTLDVIVRSHNVARVDATLSLSDGGVCLQRTFPITLDPGANLIHVPVSPLPAGAHHFHAAVQPVTPGSDGIRENNAADAVTLVRGPAKVLLVHGSETDDTTQLREAMLRQGVTIDEQAEPALLPRTPADLETYDAVVLVNVPCGGPNGLDASQNLALARYVKDLGGGLIAIGGTNTFGAAGWGGTELEKVLPINCQPPPHDPTTPGALVIAIDRSASMGERLRGSTRTKQELANESAALALRSLLPCDYAGVVAFNSTPQWIVPLCNGVEHARVDAAIRSIASAGDTEIDPALMMACDALKQIPTAPGRAAGVRNVLLVTDGRSRDANLIGTVAAMQRAGVTLSTVAIGDDVDQRRLDFLAWMGHGRSYRVTDPAMLPLTVICDARMVDASLIRERPFTPRFTGVGDWSSGFAPLPPLRGMVMTWPKRSPAVRMSVVDDQGQPVLADWTIGMGHAAVFTSDAGPRWAAAWIESPVFERFWAHALHRVLRPDPPVDVTARIVATSPDRAEVIVESPAAAAGASTMMATIVVPDGQQPATSLRLIRSSDGAYRGEFATPDNGTYVAVVHDADAASLTPAIYVASASAELSDLRSNEQAVRDIAQRTGGRLLPPFDPKANL
ncbi:MAG TPA: VWA domain-containing protein, partial [Tepidisphaeraceae bacterium]|nr:VWA domain-containing protein [Tepidisphaeraceae bacterium]